MIDGLWISIFIFLPLGIILGIIYESFLLFLLHQRARKINPGIHLQYHLWNRHVYDRLVFHGRGFFSSRRRQEAFHQILDAKNLRKLNDSVINKKLLWLALFDRYFSWYVRGLVIAYLCFAIIYLVAVILWRFIL